MYFGQTDASVKSIEVEQRQGTHTTFSIAYVILSLSNKKKNAAVKCYYTVLETTQSVYAVSTHDTAQGKKDLQMKTSATLAAERGGR